MVNTNKKRFFAFCHFLLNTILIVFSVFWVSGFFYDSTNFLFLQEFFFLFVTSIQGSLFLTGNYFSILQRASLGSVAVNLLKSFVLSVLLICTYFFVRKTPVLGQFVLFSLFATYGIIFSTYLLADQFVQFLRRHGRNQLYILLVGHEKNVSKYMEWVAKNDVQGVHFVGFLSVSAPQFNTVQQPGGAFYLGTIKEMRVVFRTAPVDEVILLDSLDFPDLEFLLEISDCLGKKVRILPTKGIFDAKKMSVEEFVGAETLVYSSNHTRDLTISFKNLFDLLFSFCLIILFSPLLVLIAFLIKTQSPGPFLFKQIRIGLHGRRFSVYKFRTMVVNAEQLLGTVKKHNEGVGPGFKMRNDPRLTPIGRWLRKFSLDELPQLFNVLRGEMSLVGPRPSLPDEVDSHDFFQLKRLSMKPGLTCLWQVDASRKKLNFHALVEKDLEYIERWSFVLDIVILFKTVKAVLSGTGY